MTTQPCPGRLGGSRIARLLLLTLLLTAGCARVQTLYYHGEASGVVRNALDQRPIPGATVQFAGDAAQSGPDGSFRITESTGWELVLMLAERGLLDVPGHRYIGISAPGYQERIWLGEYDSRFTFPVLLLPEHCGLRYKTYKEAGLQTWHNEDQPAPPRPNETFVPAGTP